MRSANRGWEASVPPMPVRTRLDLAERGKTSIGWPVIDVSVLTLGEQFFETQQKGTGLLGLPSTPFLQLAGSQSRFCSSLLGISMVLLRVAESGLCNFVVVLLFFR